LDGAGGKIDTVPPDRFTDPADTTPFDRQSATINGSELDPGTGGEEAHSGGSNAAAAVGCLNETRNNRGGENSENDTNEVNFAEDAVRSQIVSAVQVTEYRH
jgi:hypothetical protein